METQNYTLIYKIKSLGISSERKFSDLVSAEGAEVVLHNIYGDSIETLIVES